MTEFANFTDTSDGTNRRLSFSGGLTLARMGDLPKRLLAIEGDVNQIDLSKVDRVDTVGAWLIYRLGKDQNAIICGALHLCIYYYLYEYNF